MITSKMNHNRGLTDTFTDGEPWVPNYITGNLEQKKTTNFCFILRLHYVPGGHGGHVSDNREQNGITVRQRRGTG